MKKVSVMGALLAAGLIWTAASARGGQAAAQGATAPQGPWQAGRCYRVFSDDRHELHTFKVLEPPAGQWIRVQSDPASPPVPGAAPQARLWLNADAVFAVQEWTCWQ